MRAIEILRNLLSPCLTFCHRRRMNCVFDATLAVLAGDRLSLTALGRCLRGPVEPRHNIKRMDRLFGNPALHGELDLWFAALAGVVLRGVSRPVLLVDWTDLGESRHALVAAFVGDGRTLPLYAEVHPEALYGNPEVQARFVAQLKHLLPPSVRPVVVTDAGFRNPWFEAVRQVGWDFVGRLSANVLAAPDGGHHWTRVSELQERAGQPEDLGGWCLSKRQGLRARLVRRGPARKGRKGARNVNRKGVHPGSTAYKKYQQRAMSPWVLATSLRSKSAEAICVLYAMRMRIEETFRDAKSHRFGWSFEDARFRSDARFRVAILLASLALFAVYLVGQIGEQLGLQRGHQANTRKKRVLSLVFLGRMMERRGQSHLCSDDLVTRTVQRVRTYGELEVRARVRS